MRLIGHFITPPAKRPGLDDADKFQLSMRTTANCRHNAASRIEANGRVAFISTTLLSLGLVFIPLMQNSGVDLALKDSVLNMVQIFLGVAVLVYSLIIGTARYEIRALELSNNAAQIKELIHELQLIRDQNNGLVAPPALQEIQQKYARIVTSCENHEQNDYNLAMLEMPNDYTAGDFTKLVIRSQAILSGSWRFVAPTILLVAVLIMIFEMFNISKFTETNLQSWRRAPIEKLSS